MTGPVAPAQRLLHYTLPMMRGADVLALQRQLVKFGIALSGMPDGVFGPGTEQAVKSFQATKGLPADGAAGPRTLAALFPSGSAPPAVLENGPGTDPAGNALPALLPELGQPHRIFPSSVSWALTGDGISIDGAPPVGSGGQPLTVRRVWQSYGASITRWCGELGVPVELVIATICTESSGKADAIREEPGYISDEQTPARISAGLTQTLISTARQAMGMPSIDRVWLLDPDNAIRVGTTFIASQRAMTKFDPPVVACAYNAGCVKLNDGAENRWKMRQFPMGTGNHADRFVGFFNDCFAVLADAPPSAPSFVAMLRAQVPASA
jgi:Putative peptidoglycan binding domain/Transglycosylase SLT domain